jgi:hypothetical protein
MLYIDSLYRYAGEVLTDPTTVYVVDHHYDEENDVWPVQQLLDASKVDPHKHTLIFNFNIHDDRFAKYNPICAPEFMAEQEADFKSFNIVPDWTNKTAVFNFSINKQRPHRIKLLKMIEELPLTNFTYSLPWLENPYSRIAVTNYMIGTETQMPQGIRSGSIQNCETYKYLLQKNVYEPSCISLITEPTYIEREAFLTEKTIMAIYGGTIPIWVGGWRSADALRLLGFDVFDDIVDHSYETLEDPWARVRQAVLLNLNLLRNFTITDAILTRLRCNLNLLQDGVFDREVNTQLIGIPRAKEFLQRL